MKYIGHLKKGLIFSVKSILEEIEKTGIKEGFSLVITLDNKHKDSIISNRLKELYPDEMSILLANDFENLKVFPNHFEVKLIFDNFSEILKIPYATILKIEDPGNDFSIDLDLEGCDDKMIVEDNVISINFENSKKNN